MISVIGITKAFGSVNALNGVSLEHGPGVAVLLGPNGAGKTTLLRCLATLLQPDSGEIHLNGVPVGQEKDNREVRRIMSYMPQTVGFSPAVTVKQHLDRVAVLKGIVGSQARRLEVEQAIESLELTEVAKRKVRKLSGGFQRRVALAQTIMGAPKVLLLDEPTAGLDPEQRAVLRKVVGSLSAAGTSVLVSTHQPEDVQSISRSVIVMKDGKILFEGSPSELVGVAEGRVWLMDHSPDGSISWPTPDGRYRVLDAGGAGDVVAPTLEDGYLTLMRSG